MKRLAIYLVLAAFVILLPCDAISSISKNYQNTKFGYSIDYPTTWTVGFLGRSSGEAAVLRICQNAIDAQFSDGGELDPLVEVIVTDIREMKKMGARIPTITSAKDWIQWERSSWDTEEKERVGPIKDQPIIVGDLNGVESLHKKPVMPGMGPAVEVTLFDPQTEYIYSLKYLGRKPAYKESLPKFKEILAGFKLTKK